MAATTVNQDINSLLQESRDARKEAERFLSLDGNKLDLGEWVTVKKYCELFEIANTETVSNWIKRGIISDENIFVVDELNGLKLIRAIPYK